MDVGKEWWAGRMESRWDGACEWVNVLLRQGSANMMAKTTSLFFRDVRDEKILGMQYSENGERGISIY